MNITDYPLVIVKWHDAAGGSAGWEQISERARLDFPEYLVATIGWLVSRQRRQITVVQSLAGLDDPSTTRRLEGVCDSFQTIPTKMIDSIKVLRTHGDYTLPRYRRLL